MRTIVSRGIVMFAGLLVTPFGQNAVMLQATEPTASIDPRLPLLKQFLEENGAPIVQHAEAFLRAADAYELDWRLLPSLSIVESSGGKYFRNNNIFGWENGKQRFSSVRQGIFTVADRLANSKFYKDKDLDGILRTYNNVNANYPARVKKLMRTIGPADIPISYTN